ncbi:MAG: ABC transporter ATP-binding protein [Actinobacteria bacterium]|nr:MAG: ABC transporter ATP-binding protein [Actinomycetota bacterium]
MAWGGAGPGAGGHGFSGGPPGRPQGGLPFAGIPPELQTRVDKVLAGEPEHPVERVTFSQVDYDRRPLTLRRFIGPYWAAMLAAFVLVGLETAATQAGPLLTQIGIDKGIRRSDTAVLATVAILYLASVLVGGVASYARTAWTGRVGERLLFSLRVRIFSHLQRLSLEFFTREKAGRLMTRMTSDVDSLTQLFQDGMVQMVVQALTIVFVTIVLFSLNVALATVTVLAVVPAMAVLTFWFRRASDRGFDEVRDRIAEVLAHLQESLSGVRIVTAYNRARHNIGDHRNVVGDYRAANNYTARVGAFYGPGTEVIGVGGQALILLVGGNMVLRGSLTIGELAAFVLYLNAFFAPIQQMVQLYNTYQQGQAALRKLRELLATEPTVGERVDAEELPPLRGEITLEHVTFGYEPDRPVLFDIDLTIGAGETFAFVGATGAGKSTLAKLVTRFYDPGVGRVLLDGTDIRGVTLESLRRQLGVVPQEPFLFAGSIRDNIAFARPDASDQEVLEACVAVGIDDLIERLPDGMHTPCHERGVALSSGERQLLALARAFLARPRVLVLDEATSNLDLLSEAKIEHALDVLLEGRTAIIIAHRLATAMRADRLAVVHDGRIVELGTHHDLVAAGGRYAGMYATWERHAAGSRA